MSYVTEEELTRERTPSELLSWVEDKIESLDDEGAKSLRFRIGLMKPFVEEVYPVAVYACKKYGNTDLVKIRPAIGSQNYDAIVIDYSRSPASVSYLEVTQAHEGEERHLRNVYLNEHGFVPGHGPIKKAGTKKTGMSISADFEAESVAAMASRELGKVLSAVKRKERKEYPPDTSLIVWFDDGYMVRRVVSNENIDEFICSSVDGLELGFSRLVLVGEHKVTFRQYVLRNGTVSVLTSDDS